MVYEKRKKLILALIVVLMLVVGSVASYFVINRKINNKTACIYQNGELLYDIKLYNVDEPYTLKIEGENGSYNIVEVRHNEIGITKATCPDKICVHMGFISNGAVPVTCLPNRLIIVVSGGKDEPDAAIY